MSNSENIDKEPDAPYLMHLGPTYIEEYHRPYVDILNRAIEHDVNGKIKNIAISGEYGTGKSSVLEAFIEEYEEKELKAIPSYEKKNIDELIKKYKIHKVPVVSLASFINTSPNISEVKKEITKQIIYSTPEDNLPNSNFQKISIKNNGITSVYRNTLNSFFVSICLLYTAIYFPTAVRMGYQHEITIEVLSVFIIIPSIFMLAISITSSSFKYKYPKRPKYWVIEKTKNIKIFKVTLDSIAIAIAILFLIVTIFYKDFIFRYYLLANSLFVLWLILLIMHNAYKYDFFKKIKLSKVSLSKMSFSLDHTKNDYFDVFLNELVYFFAQTEKKLVIFEDLDRLDNIQIYTELKELNTLINNSSANKDPIIFIYSCKSDMFDPADFSKLFDLIVPILPYSSASTSTQSITEELINLSYDEEIDEKLLTIISKYFVNKREIKHLINEYSVYKNYFKKINNIKVNNSKLLAFIAYKISSPSDYSKISVGKSSIDEIYNKFVSMQAEYLIFSCYSTEDEEFEKELSYRYKCNCYSEEIFKTRNIITSPESAESSYIHSSMCEKPDHTIINNLYQIYEKCENELVKDLIKNSYIDVDYLVYYQSHNDVNLQNTSAINYKIHSTKHNISSYSYFHPIDNSGIAEIIDSLNSKDLNSKLSLLNIDILDYLIEEKLDINLVLQELINDSKINKDDNSFINSYSYYGKHFDELIRILSGKKEFFIIIEPLQPYKNRAISIFINNIDSTIDYKTPYSSMKNLEIRNWFRELSNDKKQTIMNLFNKENCEF